MPSLLAALRSRALIKEIFFNQEILKTASLGETVYVLEEIAKTNPYYVRAFLAEYVDFLEAQPEEDEAEEQESEDVEEERSSARSGVSVSMKNLSLEEHHDREKSENTPGATSPEPSKSSDSDENAKNSGENSGAEVSSMAAKSELTSQEHLHPETPKHEASPQKSQTSETDPYELLCAHISAKPLPPTTPDLLQYPIDYTNWVSIRETPRVISGQGTTGARTWNAALLLGFIINTDSRFEGEFDNLTVLELGAGTGLVATALAIKQHQHNFQRIIITDGDAGVVEKLRPTLELNNVDEQNIECSQLLWGETPIPPNVDVVLGADIIYDPSVLAVLLDTLGDFFASGTRYAIISRSDRNPDTTAQWEKQCDERFSREVIRVENPQTSRLPCWFHSGANDITIEIIRVR